MTVFYVTGASAGSPSIGVGSSVSTGSFAGGKLLGSIPKDELIFWTRHWQEGERESAAARAAGNVHEFSTGREAVRWLLTGDDEE